MKKEANQLNKSFLQWQKFHEQLIQKQLAIPKELFKPTQPVPLTQEQFVKLMREQRRCQQEQQFQRLPFRHRLAYTLKWNGWTW